MRSADHCARWRVRDTELHFLVGIAVAELAALHQQAHVVLKPWAAGEEGIRHVEQLLEVLVPGHEAELVVEHDDAVAHVVECDAQLVLAFAQLLEQAGILNSDHRLVGKGPNQIDLPICERVDAITAEDDGTDRLTLTQQRDAKCRPQVAHPGHLWHAVVRIGRQVLNMDGLTGKHGAS